MFLLEQGLDIDPRIVVITRLIPEAEGTTCNQRIEAIAGTRNAIILRIPFVDNNGQVTVVTVDFSSVVADWPTATNGTNTDDLGDFRPGLDAAKQYGVRSPLVEAELTKAEIRSLSKDMDLPTWDKPAQACLSSRIPYGTPVSVEALTRIAKAEEFLRGLGIGQLRVRHHGSVARIEVTPADFPALLDEEVRTRIGKHFRSIGYAYVTLDLEGFRSGSMNEVLTSDTKKRATSRANN